MSIYLDTCIVIYVVERHPLYSASIETLMRDAGAVDFCYSPLVRLECLVMPFRTNDTALLKLYEAFLGAQRLLELPSAVFDEAARLRAAHQSLKRRMPSIWPPRGITAARNCGQMTGGLTQSHREWQ